MRKTLSLFAVTAIVAVPLVLLLATSAFAGGGNSDNAKRCQQGGYTSLMQSDGTHFRNAGDCVSYAAQGGTLVAVPTVGFVASLCPLQVPGNLCVRVDGFGLEPLSVISFDLTQTSPLIGTVHGTAVLTLATTGGLTTFPDNQVFISGTQPISCVHLSVFFLGDGCGRHAAHLEHRNRRRRLPVELRVDRRNGVSCRSAGRSADPSE